jgi:hypothetical protein
MPIWTGIDTALGETPDLLSPSPVFLYAPSVNDYTLKEVIFTTTVRCVLTSAGTPVPYWWVSAELLLDVVFSTDAVDFNPDPTDGDERILHLMTLSPRISYAPTVGSHAVVWETNPAEVRNHTMRRSTALGSLAPAVIFHLTASDQHGVFATGVDITKRAFAWNINARALWERRF